MPTINCHMHGHSLCCNYSISIVSLHLNLSSPFLPGGKAVKPLFSLSTYPLTHTHVSSTPLNNHCLTRCRHHFIKKKTTHTHTHTHTSINHIPISINAYKDLFTPTQSDTWTRSDLVSLHISFHFFLSVSFPNLPPLPN